MYADYKIRWERIKDSGSYPNEKVFECDDRRDSGEDESYGQNVQRCVYEADYVLKNDKLIAPPRIIGTTLTETLARQFDGMKSEKKFRDPFQREVFMATAVSQSHASHCLKRKVGALIVNDENGIPLSVGYNDNPVGMESCFSRYNGQCYKEMVIEKKLDKMVPFFCPVRIQSVSKKASFARSDLPATTAGT